MNPFALASPSTVHAAKVDILKLQHDAANTNHARLAGAGEFEVRNLIGPPCRPLLPHHGWGHQNNLSFSSVRHRCELRVIFGHALLACAWTIHSLMDRHYMLYFQPRCPHTVLLLGTDSNF